MDKCGHIPVTGERYRHFKGGLYQIVTIAEHSETGEQLVIYQALYGDYNCYARPLGMFMGYNGNGEKRFVPVDGQEKNSTQDDIKITETGSKDGNCGKDKEDGMSGNELLFRILDCDRSKDKLELIRRYRDDIDHRMLGNLAVSLDIPADAGDDDEIFMQIAQYLETRARFETDRLR